MTTREILQKASEATASLSMLSDEMVSQVLREVAESLRRLTDDIIAANARDLARMSPDNPKYDRLKLTPERIAGRASDMENVAGLPSPLGHVLSETERPNGMTIRKVSVPFGVIGVIYEARPNVTADVFSLDFVLLVLTNDELALSTFAVDLTDFAFFSLSVITLPPTYIFTIII